MCGATGEVRLDDRAPDIAAVAAMVQVMAPRVRTVRECGRRGGSPSVTGG